MNQRLHEQTKQIEFLQRKVQFQQNQSRSAMHHDHRVMNNLSNDCNGLLLFCGSAHGSNSTQNSVEWINLKTKSKHSLFSKSFLEDINRIYNHQYVHLAGARNSIDFSTMDQILDDVQNEYQSEEDEKQNGDIPGVHKSNGHSMGNDKITSVPSLKSKKKCADSWDVEDNGFCTGYNIPFSYIQPYLVNSSFGSNTSGIDSIFSFDNASFWKTEKVTMAFRCGGVLSRSGEKLSRVDGCVLETGDWFQLPYCNKVEFH